MPGTVKVGMPSKIKKSQNIRLLTFFASLCLYLSAIEYAIPKPLPFLRLGLANLPILLGLEVFPVATVLLLTFLKILLQAFISGTFFSYVFVFSLAGTLASSLVMIFVYKICTLPARMYGKTFGIVSFAGISVAGAFANNLAQIACARYLLFGENTKYIAPLLLVFGLVTGILLGLFCNAFASNSQWYKNCCLGCGKSVFAGRESLEENKKLHSFSTGETAENSACGKKETFALFKFAFCMLSFAFFIQIKNLYLLWGTVLFFFVLDEIIKKGRVKLLPSIIIVLSVTFFALLTPVGKVLFRIGGWKITQTSLEMGLHRSGFLVGMVFISQCAVDKSLRLPGKAGAFVAGVFYYFDLLVSEKIKFSRKNLVKSIDERLLKICAGGVE